MDQPEPIGPGELICQDAPRMLEHPDGTVGSRCLDSRLNVDLVEAQRSDSSPGGPGPNVRLELLNGRQTGQGVWIMH